MDHLHNNPCEGCDEEEGSDLLHLCPYKADYEFIPSYCNCCSLCKERCAEETHPIG